MIPERIVRNLPLHVRSWNWTVDADIASKSLVYDDWTESVVLQACCVVSRCAAGDHGLVPPGVVAGPAIGDWATHCVSGVDV